MLRAIVQLTDILEWTSPGSGSEKALMDGRGNPRTYDVILYHIPPFVSIGDKAGRRDPVLHDEELARWERTHTHARTSAHACPRVSSCSCPALTLTRFRAMHCRQGRLLMARSVALPLMCCRSSSPRVELCSVTSFPAGKRSMMPVGFLHCLDRRPSFCFADTPTGQLDSINFADGACNADEVRSKDVALEMMDGLTRLANPAAFCGPTADAICDGSTPLANPAPVPVCGQSTADSTAPDDGTGSCFVAGASC